MDAPGAAEAKESVPQDRHDSNSNAVKRSTYPHSDHRDRPDRLNDEEEHDPKGIRSDGDDEGDEEAEEEGEDDEEEEEEEPRLKYAYMTKHLGAVYRNGDATSSFLAAGDKMVWYPG